MELRISTRQVLKLLYILSWIIFIGVCVEAGSFIFNAVFSLAVNSYAARYFNLSDLFEYNRGYFVVELMLMSIAGIMRALMFYLIVKVLGDKKLNISQPFTKEAVRFIFKIAFLALGIGMFSYWGSEYTAWLVNLGVKMPDLRYLRLGRADVWLFMGIVLLVIAQLFKRGIEIQSENELTI